MRSLNNECRFFIQVNGRLLEEGMLNYNQLNLLGGFKLKRPIGIQIEGCIYANDGENLKHDEFLDAFIDFIESKGWNFGGGSSQVDEEGKKIDDID